MATHLGLPESIIDQLDAKTKRRYVEAEMVKKPLDKYKGMIKRTGRTRIKELESYTDEIISGLHCWTSLVQGRGVPSTVDRAAAVLYIEQGIREWLTMENRRGDEASAGAAIGADTSEM